MLQISAEAQMQENESAATAETDLARSGRGRAAIYQKLVVECSSNFEEEKEHEVSCWSGDNHKRIRKGTAGYFNPFIQNQKSTT